jgi:hypothetical protein
VLCAPKRCPVGEYFIDGVEYDAADFIAGTCPP